jgi:hypothetical protein
MSARSRPRNTAFPPTSRWTPVTADQFNIELPTNVTTSFSTRFVGVTGADGHQSHRQALAELFAAPPEFDPVRLPRMLEADIYQLSKDPLTAPFYAQLAKVLYQEEYSREITTRQSVAMATAAAASENDMIGDEERRPEAEELEHSQGSAEDDMMDDEEWLPEAKELDHSQGSADTDGSQSMRSSPPIQHSSSSFRPSSEAEYHDEDDDAHVDREQCETRTESMLVVFLNSITNHLYRRSVEDIRDMKKPGPSLAFSFESVCALVLSLPCQ